jgi:putative transcriptional regulator
VKGGGEMEAALELPGISYNRLWKRMIDLDVRKKELRKILSPSTISKLNRNELVSMEILLKLCERLNCQISDIVEVIGERKSA